MDGPTVEVIWLRRNGIRMMDNLKFARKFITRELNFVSVIDKKKVLGEPVSHNIHELVDEVNTLCNSGFKVEDLDALMSKAKPGYDEFGPILEQDHFSGSILDFYEDSDAYNWDTYEHFRYKDPVAPNTFYYKTSGNDLIRWNAAWIVVKYKGIILGGINLGFNQDVDLRVIQNLSSRTRIKKVYYNDQIIKEILKFGYINSITKYCSCKLAEHCMGIKFSIADLLIGRSLKVAEESGIEVLYVGPHPVMEGILKKRFGFQDFCSVFECVKWGEGEILPINQTYICHTDENTGIKRMVDFDVYKFTNVNSLVYLFRPIKTDIISLRAKELWGYGTKPSLDTREIPYPEKRAIIDRFNEDLDARLDKEYKPLDKSKKIDLLTYLRSRGY